MSKSEDDAPSAPEQAHGDALTALDRILLRGDNAKCGDFQIVRKALTDGGVPYVPEEVRWLPERLRNGLLPTGDRVTQRAIADELERALASAPAVCEWTYARTSLGRDGYKGACGADWWCEEGYGPAVISDVHPYCHGCGRRIQIAAAPSDGGSHE